MVLTVPDGEGMLLRQSRFLNAVPSLGTDWYLVSVRPGLLLPVTSGSANVLTFSFGIRLNFSGLFAECDLLRAELNR